MSKWLAKAKNIAGTNPIVPTSQPFELKCPCGQEIKGERRATFRRVLCKECGEPFFVLPNDVYPRPKPKKKKSRTRAQKGRSKNLAVSPFAGIGDQVADIKVKIKQRADASASKAKESIKAKAGTVRRIVTPFRLVLVAIVGLVIGTMISVQSSRAKANAAVVMREAAELGFEALREQELEEAATHFDVAAKASRTAGLDDPYARLVRQMNFETQTIEHLATSSIYEAILEANQHAANDTMKRWKIHFELHYTKPWFVFQGEIRQRPNPDEESNTKLYELQFPLAVSNRHVVIIFESPSLDRLESAAPVADVDSFAAKPQFAIFAAQLQDCELHDNGSEWQIRAKPGSAFLWSNYDLLMETGMGPDEIVPETALRAVLSRQTDIQGLADRLRR